MMTDAMTDTMTVEAKTSTASESRPWAQIALVNEISWCIIGRYRQDTGLMNTLSMNNLRCPVVLTTGVPRTAKTRIFKQYVDISGVFDVDAMIRDLVNAGGVVSYPSSNPAV